MTDQTPVNTIHSISDLPSTPVVYAMYGGRGRSLHVAYVGIGGKLRGRIEQHLVRRDSSVATGTSAACLNPDYVTEVRWWEHPDFSKQEVLEAVELVAIDVLALRSRGGITGRAKQLYSDEEFRASMRVLLEGEFAGVLVIPTLQDAIVRISEIEKRLLAIEKELGGMKRASK